MNIIHKYKLVKEYDIIVSSWTSISKSLHIYMNLGKFQDTMKYYIDNVPRKVCNGFIKGIENTGILTVRISKKFYKHVYSPRTIRLVHGKRISKTKWLTDIYSKEVLDYMRSRPPRYINKAINLRA